MKRRIPFIHVEALEDIQIHWNEKDECFELRNPEGKVSNKHLVSLADVYHREGKSPKVLRQVNNATGGIISLIRKAATYDRYLAIDTSYKQFRNNFLCVTACLGIDQNIDHDHDLKMGDKIAMFALPRLVFLAKPGAKPERYGWMRVIDALLKSDLYHNDWWYGVTVDSDLEDLQKIYSRQKAIVDNFFVPENMSFIYASADVGREALVNKLIRATDRVAKSSLETALKAFDGPKPFEVTREYWDIAVLNAVTTTL